jgi:large subunit ribosomal protein L9
MNGLAIQKKSAENKLQNEIKNARVLAERINQTAVKIPMKVGENGKMFGSVSNKEIAAAMSSQLGIDVDRKKINLSEPIKNIGVVKVPVKLYAEITAQLSVEIVAEG